MDSVKYNFLREKHSYLIFIPNCNTNAWTRALIVTNALGVQFENRRGVRERTERPSFRGLHGFHQYKSDFQYLSLENFGKPVSLQSYTLQQPHSNILGLWGLIIWTLKYTKSRLSLETGSSIPSTLFHKELHSILKSVSSKFFSESVANYILCRPSIKSPKFSFNSSITYFLIRITHNINHDISA